MEEHQDEHGQEGDEVGAVPRHLHPTWETQAAQQRTERHHSHHTCAAYTNQQGLCKVVYS